MTMVGRFLDRRKKEEEEEKKHAARVALLFPEGA
jgi:hypothetical protein